MTARTYIRMPVKVTVSKKVGGQDGLGLRAQERRPAVRRPLGYRIDAGILQDFPDRGRGDPDAQDEQLAVDAPVAPAVVLPRQAQHQYTDGPYRRGSADPPGAGDAGVVSGDQVAVPTQHGLGAYQQSDPAEHVAGESVQQGGEQGPISRGEPDLLAVQLPFEDHDLVPQGEDFRVLGPVAHGKQPQHRQRVGHAEVGQFQQHEQASSPSGRQRSDAR
jgi:hypothetical protein